MLNEPLIVTVKELEKQFNLISEERRKSLQRLADFIHERVVAGKQSSLVFICTHNSRRSHLAQVWAQLASHLYEVPKVQTYSGGTEVTAFNIRALNALKQAGFGVRTLKEGENPLYGVSFARNAPLIQAYSKVYDAKENPKECFAAIMTCSHADEHCPAIPGASLRLAISYQDPKDFDQSPQEREKYRERSEQIGREMLYTFSLVGEKR